MARKKTVKQKSSKDIDDKLLDITEQNFADAFQNLIMKEYGALQPPEPFITPTGIRHLDAILGGGFISATPLCITSTPETGKSTFAFQFCKQFLDLYPDSVAIYMDAEQVSGDSSNDYQVSRSERYGLVESRRFQYDKTLHNRLTVSDPINKFAELKRAFELKTEKEFKLLIVLDSLAALPAAVSEGAETPQSITGRKSAELTLLLDKVRNVLALNNIVFLAIDQVRPEFKMEQKGKFTAPTEKSVGNFKNFKVATQTAAWLHRVSQFLILSKKKEITINDGMDVDGWYVDAFTEKNKCAASKFEVRCVFDKNDGLDKIWSEFEFISSYTPTENKLMKKENSKFKPFMDLCAKAGGGGYWKIIVKNPETEEIERESKSFYRKDVKTLYNGDPEFKEIFDYAVDTSIEYRIKKGMLRLPKDIVESLEEPEVKEKVLEETTEPQEQETV